MNKGEKMSEDQKRKVSENRKGKCLGNKFRAGKAPFNKGKKGLQVAWNKGISPSNESILKMVKKRKEKGNYIAWNKGIKNNGIVWNKGKKGVMPEPWNKNKPHLAVRGNKNPNWKGGITPENRKIKISLEYRLWRLSIFERDKFLCQMPDCDKTERYLNAHHIKIFAENPELRLDIKNGITLCKKCHYNINGKEKSFEQLFNEIIILKP